MRSTGGEDNVHGLLGNWSPARRVAAAIIVAAAIAATAGSTTTSSLEREQQGLQIAGVSAPDSVPRLGKLEITFAVAGSVAANPQMPYDPAPPPGIAANLGITVNAEFSRDGFRTVHTIPAFLYQEFDYQVKANRDWFNPLDQYSWRVRFSPPLEGAWEYRLTATDASGTFTTPPRTFTVLPSSEPGFVRVSSRDSRYFEFENGELFLGLGYNAGLDWFNPVRSSEARLATMGDNGVSLSRIWLSQSGIFGSAWNPWYGLRGDYGGYIPRTGVTPAGSPATMRLRLSYAESGGNRNTGYFEACRFIGGFQSATAVKRQTTYRFRVRYAGIDITGPRNTGFPNHGFVLKVQNPADGNWHTNCYDSGTSNSTGQVISAYGGNTTGEAWIEGTWASGNNDFLPPFYLALENVNAQNPATGRIPAAYVSYVEIREALPDGTLTGPNIVAKPSMEHQTYFEQRFSYAFDRIVESAHQHGVYFKVVVLEKDEDILSQLQPSGEFGAASSVNFYGNYRSMTATRWLQRAWWRYLQARWGYSPNIHSWELLNEGDPASDRHYTLADEFGAYMRQFAPNHHMVTTSFWHSLPVAAFWKNTGYPNLDYVDLHAYVSTSQTAEFNIASAKDPVVRARCGTSNPCFKTSMKNDAALYHAEHSLQAFDRTLGKPLVRGESGLNTPSAPLEDPNLARDDNGVWLHNLIWSSVNPGGMYELYWWYQNLLQRPGPDGTRSNGLHEIFRSYRDFVADVPLNNGQYRDLAAVVSRPDDVRVLGQKDTASGRAHLWIQNRRHTWCAVVGGVADCPYTWDGSRLSGTVAIGGFGPGATYQVQWTTFDASGAPSQPAPASLTADASGNLVVVLDQLPATVVDAGLKVGATTASGLPSAPRNLRVQPAPTAGQRPPG